MTTQKNLNGSVDILAKAMRQVFSEAVEGAVEPLRKDISVVQADVDGIRENMATKTDLETMNANVQAQLAQNRKDVSSDVRRILKKGG